MRGVHVPGLAIDERILGEGTVVGYNEIWGICSLSAEVVLEGGTEVKTGLY